MMYATLATVGMPKHIKIKSKGSQHTFSNYTHPYPMYISKYPNWYTIYQITPGHFISVCQPSDANDKKPKVKHFENFKNAYAYSIKYLSEEV